MPNRPPKKKNKNMSDKNPEPQVTLQDMAALVRIIDVASRRGTFEGKELTSVGAVRDKLEVFIQHHVPQKKEQEAPKEEEQKEKEPEFLTED